MDAISKIKKEIENHPSNNWARKKGYSPVFTASPKSKLVIIGQAPGIRAQESHIPWNDPSGDNLRNWLGITKEIFYDTSKIALTPMDFYFPGKGKTGDLPPRKDFAAMWHQKIFNEMKEVKLILLIGQYSQQYYLKQDRSLSLTKRVYNYKKYLPQYFPLPHPSPRNLYWLRKNPWFEKEVIPDLKIKISSIF